MGCGWRDAKPPGGLPHGKPPDRAEHALRDDFFRSPEPCAVLSRSGQPSSHPFGDTRPFKLRQRGQQEALKHEQQDIEQRLARLVAAIETGGEAASLVAKVKELEARRVAIAGELHSFRPVPRLRPEVVEGRLTEWRRLLRQSTTQGRAVLQRVLQGRITFTPKGGGYEFEAPTRSTSYSWALPLRRRGK